MPDGKASLRWRGTCRRRRCLKQPCCQSISVCARISRSSPSPPIAGSFLGQHSFMADALHFSTSRRRRRKRRRRRTTPATNRRLRGKKGTGRRRYDRIPPYGHGVEQPEFGVFLPRYLPVRGAGLSRAFCPYLEFIDLAHEYGHHLSIAVVDPATWNSELEAMLQANDHVPRIRAPRTSQLSYNESGSAGVPGIWVLAFPPGVIHWSSRLKPLPGGFIPITEQSRRQSIHRRSAARNRKTPAPPAGRSGQMNGSLGHRASSRAPPSPTSPTRAPSAAR